MRLRSLRNPPPLFNLLLASPLILMPCCGGGGGGGGAAPGPSNVAPSISTHPSNQIVEKGGSAAFSVVASGTPAPSYQWTKNGVALSGANLSTLSIPNAQAADRATYAVQASNSAGSVTSNPATLTVHDLYDDFLAGDGKWSFLYCNRSITNHALTMVSTDATAQSVASSASFPTPIPVPWMMKGDVAILNGGLYTGISVGLDDSGSLYAIQYMWCALVGNSTTTNWIWLWWVPTLTNSWLPWDSTCKGYSSAITTTQMNSLELSLDASKRCTMKVNGNALLNSHDAVLQMQSTVGKTLNVTAKLMKLRGANATTTTWDRIVFSGQGAGFVAEPMRLQPPPPPTGKDLQDLVERLETGETPTLKELLERRGGR
ncbi:MAG: immunoglobulin domain-containing protein [Acidobacteria bacterium]|nr:immunoglobulin domain-containing protein [Acidobacteriota bacterium]